MYIANFIAFSPFRERLVTPIETFEDLSKQTAIQYGILKDGSTMNFFNKSTLTTMKTMWNFMQQHTDNVFVSSNRAGIEKVRLSKGRIIDTEILCEVFALTFCRKICLYNGVCTQ
jgi:hypothetical protein